ncbi:MAG: insulinase family protein [Flavobacteriaceae bacterium]|nr:insulinase family protein [Flavobacteriaceae bacterium]
MKSCITILASILFVGSGMAQQRISGFSIDKMPLWEMRKYINDPLNVRYYTFKNGLTLLTSNQKASPRIYTMIAVKTGSKNDPSSNTGLAHYLEHMLFKGTDQYGSLDWSKEEPLLLQIDALYGRYNQSSDSAMRKAIYHEIDSIGQLAAKFAIANEYDKMCQALGAEGTNAFTSYDETVYINDIPSNNVSKWLSLESERFRKPVLRLFHTELEAVYEEKNISLDRDQEKVYEMLDAELFKKHNYGLQTTIGSIAHLKNPNLEAIRNYYKEYYVPNNMAIIMSGDFDPDSVANEVAQKFNYMQHSDVTNYVYEQEEPRNIERSFDVTGEDAENITIGFRIPAVGTQEARAAQLIDLLLNNSTAGLIDLNLVKQQKVLAANSGVELRNDYGVFLLTGKPKEGQKLEDVKQLLLGELEKIRLGNFDEQMLKSIILNEEIGKIKQFKDNTSRCFFLKDAFIQNIDYRDAFNELAEMQTMTKEYIVDFANEVLNRDRVVIYKRKGEPLAAEKINKPEIHPVELNRDKESTFLKNWLAIPTLAIKPEVVVLTSAIQTQHVGPANLRYVKNENNRLFNLDYRYDIGKWHNKSLVLIPPYLKLVGTDAYTAEEIGKTLYRWGCNFTAMEGNTNFVVNVSGPEEFFDSAVCLLDKMLSNPTIDEAVFSAMIDDILKNRTDAKSNPNSIRRALSQYAMYGSKNPTTWMLDNNELKKMQAADVVLLIKRLKTIQHSINYFGQRDLPSVAKTLSKLHALPMVTNSGKPESAFSMNKFKSVNQLFVEQESNTPTVYFVHYNQVQASINWFYKGAVLNEADLPIITAFNQYFGGDMSSVVFQNIRESKALAYSTYAMYSLPSMKGKHYIMTGFVGTQADKFHDAIGAMNELLQDLPQNTRIFELAKESIVKRIETNRLSPEDYLGAYYLALEMGFSLSYPNMVMYHAVPTMTMSDITQFHANNVRSKPYIMSVIGSDKRLSKSDLGRYGKVVNLTLEDIFGY